MCSWFPGTYFEATKRRPYLFAKSPKSQELTVVTKRFVERGVAFPWKKTSSKLTWQPKMDFVKMYLLLNMGDFNCHVSAPEGILNSGWIMMSFTWKSFKQVLMVQFCAHGYCIPLSHSLRWCHAGFFWFIFWLKIVLSMKHPWNQPISVQDLWYPVQIWCIHCWFFCQWLCELKSLNRTRIATFGNAVRPVSNLHVEVSGSEQKKWAETCCREPWLRFFFYVRVIEQRGERYVQKRKMASTTNPLGRRPQRK